MAFGTRELMQTSGPSPSLVLEGYIGGGEGFIALDNR
jgi:hypothetical protein